MESAAYQLLQSATYRTLHAQAFSRSSSQATHVLTDLLSRYLILLTSTCAKYAQHSNRLGLAPQDAFNALEELGIDISELQGYCSIEGVELSRYTLSSTRRMDDLREMRAQLDSGLKQDRDDAIPLVYAPYPQDEDQFEGPAGEMSAPQTDEESDVEEALEEDQEEGRMDISPNAERPPGDNPLPPLSIERKDELELLRPQSPPLPLSPVSNPHTPSRKRPRLSDWQRPDYVPQFLPPFPRDSDSTPPSPSPPEERSESSFAAAQIESQSAAFSQVPPAPVTSASAVSDYTSRIPYSQSTLSSTPAWHLPESMPPRGSRNKDARSSDFLKTDKSLVKAFLHILRNPPPPNLHTATPARHKVALALVNQSQTNSRWESPDTLFSSVAPSPPRVVPVGPSYPIPVSELPSTSGSKPKKDEPEKKPPLPSAMPRSIASSERITALVSQQTSRIPDLARQVLPPPIYNRATRLNHPPVLTKPNGQKLVYGPGVNAPWNAPPVLSGPETKGKEKEEQGPLPDARLYATWDYEQKHHNLPLSVSSRRSKGVMNGHGGANGSTSGGMGLTLSIGALKERNKAS